MSEYSDFNLENEEEANHFKDTCETHLRYYCKDCIIDNRHEVKEDFVKPVIKPVIKPETIVKRERFNSEGDWDSLSVTEFNRAPLSEDEND